jgi:hypothetical protein
MTSSGQIALPPKTCMQYDKKIIVIILSLTIIKTIFLAS